jgi:hypothetical protein
LPEVKAAPKALTAERKLRLVLLFRAAALAAVRERFLADLMMGIVILYDHSYFVMSLTTIPDRSGVCKESP